MIACAFGHVIPTRKETCYRVTSLEPWQVVADHGSLAMWLCREHFETLTKAVRKMADQSYVTSIR